jgi:hypothetical protein
MTLAKEEGITDRNELILLKTAALFHDTGYTKTYENHEEESCRIAKEALPDFGYSVQDIDTICRIIMKTKLPSVPETILEKIICDADLDYLGRDDFFDLGDKLYRELHEKGKLNSHRNWNEIQVNFLKAHHFKTSSAQAMRARKKAEHVRQLEERLQS